MNFRKYKILLLIIPLTLSSLLFCSNTPANFDSKKAILSRSIIENLSRYHFKPLKVDDSLSVKVYNKFLERLDFGKRFLTQTDVDSLKQFKYDIDDNLKSGKLKFFDYCSDLISKKIDKVEDFYKDILNEGFDFTKNEDLQTDPEKKAYAKNDAELKDYWRKMLKYEVLTKILNEREIQKNAKDSKDTTIERKTENEIKEDAVKSVEKKYKNFFRRLNQYEVDDRLDDFLTTVAMTYDPHTNYFPPKDKEDFDIRMSGKLEGIGALLTQTDEYIKVERIIPGSPSWKQGELENGDLILKVAQGDGEPVDVVDMRLDKAVRLIRGEKGTEVRLTVKKADGRIKVIPIIRDVVYREESFAKSIILENDKNGPRIGYIKLPSFYADFQKRDSRRSSTDMKREIDKLKEKGIDGMIIDLRDNGGGSLSDAVKIAGLFIEEGPIVQVHESFGRPQIKRDNDKSVEYDGPLVILVNSFSASASEIMAAAMQDYDRAVIIGSRQTFGKGTVQRFIDLDRTVRGYDDLKPLGALKLTIQKFYRINGGTTQLEGVTPDIILPDNYNHIEIGEKELDFALVCDSIAPCRYEHDYFDFSSADLKIIKELSKKRTQSDSTFILIDENARRLEKIRDKTDYSLNMKKFSDQREKRLDEVKKYDNIGKDTLDLQLVEVDSDAGSPSDSTKTARTEAWHDALRKDIYINEAVNVVKDLIGLKLSKN